MKYRTTSCHATQDSTVGYNRTRSFGTQALRTTKHNTGLARSVRQLSARCPQCRNLMQTDTSHTTKRTHAYINVGFNLNALIVYKVHHCHFYRPANIGELSSGSSLAPFPCSFPYASFHLIPFPPHLPFFSPSLPLPLLHPNPARSGGAL